VAPVITPEDLKAIKENCLLWSNNCGGCETCSQFFGSKTPPYDHYETYQLVCMIEERDAEIKRLKEAKVEQV
jgi:hypothetical protein